MIELQEALRVVKEAGYMVTKVPECNRDFPHGRHPLITRTKSCPGKEPIPHGYHSSFGGSFGTWINCLCGHAFADYGFTGGASPWIEHKVETGVG